MQITQLRRDNRLAAFIKGIVHEKGVLGFIFVAIVGVLLFNLYSLSSFPPVFIDESWYANVAWNWLTEGVNVDSIHALARQNVPWPYLGILPWLISFAVAGLGLVQARTVAWVFGLILIVGTFLVGRRSFGRIVGALAALLVVINPAYLQASHYARPDIMLAAFGMFSYFLLISGFENERRWSHFFAGLLIGLSIDIHLNALIFILGFFILYLYQYKKGIFRSSGFWFFVLGGLLSLIYYASVHILPDASEFLNFYRYSLGSEHQMPVSSLNPMVLLRSFREEIGRYHFLENNLIFALLGACVAYLAWRRKPADQHILIFTGAAFMGFALFAGNKHDIYAILLLPFFLLIIAEGLVSLVKAGAGHTPTRAFSIALILLYLVIGLLSIARPILESRGYDYYAVTDRIQRVVPNGSIIMGLPNWWLGLVDYDYRSVMGLTYLHRLEGASLEEGFETLKPNYLIFDPGLNWLLVEEGYFLSEGFEVYKLPRAEFKNILTERAEMVDQFTDSWHGYFEIYKINWGN